MGPDLTGFCVDCRVDIPVPSNVYRYYLPGTSHLTAAANREVRKGFLLVADAQTLIADASGSNVLALPFAPTPGDAQFGNTLCSAPDAKALNATGRQE